MRVVSINSCTYGSTGNIMLRIMDLAEKQGEGYVAVPKGRHFKDAPGRRILPIGSRFAEDSHIILGRVTGLQGFFSYFSTKKFLKKVKELDPDLLHLHNLHNSYINLPALFRFIKKNDIPVVWTLHDCWAFTGHCPYFSAVNCEEWKTGCHNCPICREYPCTWVDNTRFMWRTKKKWFCGVKNLTLVTPSEWLAGLARQSFLKEYPVRVIRNGIDLGIFSRCKNDVREKYRIPAGKKILLGVAFDWGYRKGLDVFAKLAASLSEEQYQIVLVGTDEPAEKELPDNIICIRRTQNQRELAELYSAADLFVNPTREEVFGLVNIEALACGTPVLTFDTGGSPECIDATCGAVVPCDDVQALIREIVRICTDAPYSEEACRARAETFDRDILFEEYIRLYGEINE